MSKEQALDANTLRRLLSYDPQSGEFHRVARNKAVKLGMRAGCRNVLGYWQIRVEGPIYLAHRLAWLYVHGEWPSDQIDHIDGDRCNNRISNLRQCSNKENGQNKKSYKGSTSKYVGVNWSSAHNQWMASITIDGKKNYLGVFESEEKAALEYSKAKRLSHSFNPIANRDGISV